MHGFISELSGGIGPFFVFLSSFKYFLLFIPYMMYGGWSKGIWGNEHESSGSMMMTYETA